MLWPAAEVDADKGSNDGSSPADQLHHDEHPTPQEDLGKQKDLHPDASSFMSKFEETMKAEMAKQTQI